MLAMLVMFGAVLYAIPSGAAINLGDMKGKLVIVHTNDTHGHDKAVEGGSLGTAAVANVKKAYESAGADVLLLHAGDSIFGTPLVNLSEGETAIEFMNAAGYDAMVPGNHEFDYGLDRLLQLENKMKFPLLATNITYKASGNELFEGTKIFTMKSGLKVGVIGITTPQTMTSSNPASVSALDFTAERDLYTLVQKDIVSLKAAGCGFIIALGHLGSDSSAAPNRSLDVLANTNGIDLFIDGHSHTTYENGYKSSNSLLVSTGEYLNRIGLVIKNEDTLTASLIDNTADYGLDSTVAALIKKYDDEVSAEYDKPFAKTLVDLNGTRAGGDVYDDKGKPIASFPTGIGNRTAETNFGDLAADAQLYGAEKAYGIDVDVSIINGGNIRESLIIGDITKRDFLTVFPFDNTVVTFDMLGSEILEALEAACYCTPDSNPAFPQVAGITFTIDASVPYEKGELYPGSTFYAPKAPGSRVKDIRIGGEPINLDKLYTVAASDFLASGGDSYYSFKIAYDRNGIDNGTKIEDTNISFVTDVLGGEIGLQYAKPQGRINIINTPENSPGQYTDIPVNSWYYTPVSYVLLNDIMSGFGSGHFMPNNGITRAQLYQVIYNFEGQPDFSTPTSFTDVAENNWYYDAASWAEENGLTDGTGRGNFSPDKIITRQEISKAIVSYFEYLGFAVDADATILNNFKDSGKISSWAIDSMAACVSMKILSGYGNGTIMPDKTATRAEIAQIFYNLTKQFNLIPVSV